MIFDSCLQKDSVDLGGVSGNTISLDLTDAGNEPLNNVGGAIKIYNPNDSSRPMIVTRISAGEIAAYSSRCSYEGCEVPLPVADRIVCPCCGSIFDGSGNLLSGPAKRGLMNYTATIDGTTITIQA